MLISRVQSEETGVMEAERTMRRGTRAGRPCGLPRPAPTLTSRTPPDDPGHARGDGGMAEELDRLTVAQAVLLQPMLRAVARLMPARAMLALRAEVRALRDEARRRGTPQGDALAEACELALVDLTIEGPDVVTGREPPGRGH